MKKSLRLLTLIFFSFAMPVFGDEYSWKGGSVFGSNHWAYGPNWRNESAGTEGITQTNHPGKSSNNDIAYIAGNYEIDLEDFDITVDQLFIRNYGTLNKTSSWTVTLTAGDGSLTFNKMLFNRSAQDSYPLVTGTLVLDCPIICKGSIQTHSETTFTANEPITLGANSTITSYGNGLITINQLSGPYKATLYCDTDDLINILAYDTTSGNVPSIAVASGSKHVSLVGGTIAGLDVNAATTVTGAMTVDGDLVVNSDLTVEGDLNVTGKLTVTGSGKLTVNGDLDVTGATKNEGTITTKAGAAFSSLLIDGGSLVNTGSGAVTATTFTIGSHDASVTNSSTGSITVGTLTGAYKANLDNSSTGSITVSGYGSGTDAPNIVLAASSQNVSLKAGSIASLTLGASAQANVAGTLTVKGATNNAGTINAAGITLNFNGAVSGASGTITSSNIKVTSADDSNLGTVAMTATTSITNNGAGKVTVTKLSGEQTAMLSNGSTAGGVAISGYDATNVPTIKTSGSDISLEAGKIAALTVNASSAAAITGDLTVTGNIDNNGTLTSSSAKVTMTGAAATLGGTRSATFTDFAYEPTATTAALTIEKDNTFDNLTVNSPTGSDVTLTINGAQTLTGTLDLKGTSGHPLTIEGSGSITLPSTQDGGQYLSVARGGVKIGDGSGSGNFYKATDSSFSSGMSYGMDNNWVLLGDMDFEWTGDNGTAWDDPLNWNLNLVPGLASAAGGVDTTLYPVTIPDSPSSGNLPIAAAAYTVKSLQVGTSSGASLELSSTADITVTAASGALVNHGTIVYSSSGRITNGTAFINDAANGGTVEFTGTAAAADISAVQYYNLISSGAGDRTASTALTVLNNLTISGSGKFTANDALTVTNALTVSDGNANFNGATSVKTASITTTGSLALGDGAGDSFEVTDGALSLPSTIATSPATLTLAGTITASGGITLGHDANLAANTTFASATTIDAPVKLTGAFTVENTAALTTTLTNTLTLVNASLKNTGAAASGYIVFEGTADQTFTPNAAAYSKVTVNKTSGAFTVDQALSATDFVVTKTGTLAASAAVTAANLSINQSTSAAFGGKVTVTTAFTDAAAAGDIAFNAGCAFTPATTFLTNGTVTLNGTSDACAFTAGLEHTAGDTAISGDLTTTNAAIKLGATTLAADTTINAGSGAVEINGTLNGAKAITSIGSGALTLAGAVGATAAPTTITATGPTIVTAPSITTSGAQTYKSDLTFNADCAVTGPVKMTGATATLAGTGKATFTDFTAANATSLTIENDNSFTKFTCKAGNATLTINGAQTITGTTGSAITLKGTSATSLLTINGNGNIKLSADQSSGQYLKVTRNSVAIQSTSATDRYFIAKDSQFDSDPLYGMNNNWIILNSAMVFEWTGATSTAWGDRSNWNYNLIPGTAHGLGSGTSITVDTRNYDVKIPDSPTGVSTNFPVVTAEQGYSVGNFDIGESASSTASVTINTAGTTTGDDIGAIKIYINTTAVPSITKKLTNYGKIIYQKPGRITQSNDFTNDTANGGTVEFATGSAAADLADVAYYNLIVSGNDAFSTTAGKTLTVYNDMTYSGGGSLTINDTANISNDLTISGTGTFTSNAALTVTKALTASNGSVNFNASSDATETKAESADFTPASSATLKLSLGNNEGDKFTLTGASSSLVLPAGLNALTLAGTITAPGGITLGHDATLADNTTFASAMTTAAAVTLSGAHTVTTSAALTTSATNTLTLQDANLANTGEVTNGNIIFTETALKPTQTFTPNTASTYQKVEINKTSGGSMTVNQELKATDFVVTKNKTLTINAAAEVTNFTITDNTTFNDNAALTAENLTITKNESATFGGKVTVTTSYTDAAAAGDIAFNAGCSFTFTSPVATFLTSRTLALAGTPAACAFTSGLTHTAGTTMIKGQLNTTNAPITLGATNLAADTTINAGSGAVSINGPLNGAYNFTSNGSGALTFAGPVGTGVEANILKKITVTSPTIVSATPIRTSGLQLYKDDLSFTANCTVTGNVQAAANVATSGAAKATFNNELWLYTITGASAKDSTLGLLNVKGNLYIAKTGQAATVASAVSAQNILLLHGTLNVNAALSSTKDIILLGSAYNIDDKKETTDSQVEGLFAYKPAAPLARKCAASYTDAFPTKCPDGTSFGDSWSGAVVVDTAKTVAAGQNFYANGLSSITGSGEWYLALPNNDLQTAAFAEIYNSSITNCSANYKVAAAENVTASGCTNITTTRPVIFEAYTVYDDVVYISFKDSAGNSVKIENSCNEISAAAANISNSAGAYAATYIDENCQYTTDDKGDITGGFYIKSDNKWNTDANGTNAGADQSTDRGTATASPTNRSAIPYLNLPKALSTLYETLRDDSKNRIAHYYSATPSASAASAAAGQTYTAVADKCAPVLIKVLSGQEIHESPATQKDYDAHNFVEFVYSEPVDIASVSGGTTVAASDVNVQAVTDLGHATGASGITFAGLATTASGEINASLKTGSGSPHALYRNFSDTAGATPVDHAARVRVSIAGWVDGTVAGSYKNWAGYISSAIAPSGNITRIDNANIKDKSPAQNSLDANPSRPNHALPTLTVQTSDGAANELYGTWDVTPPSFAPVRINGTTTWVNPHYDGSQEFEYVGASYGSTGTLSAIEVHWFDNEPTWTESLQWFSRVGWGHVATSGTEYSSITSYAADVRGGSRPDTASANATAGGIRYCSLYNAYNAFKYSVAESGTYHDFTQNIQGGAESSLFTYAGTAPDTHTTGAEDGLYCKLFLDDTSLQPKTTFLMKFDSNACYITDLAGNRIQCGNITIKSVDRTPPEYLMTAVPLGTKQMLIIFSKELNIDTLTVYDSASVHHDYSALEYIPKALELTGGSGPIAIDQSVPATCVFRNDKATGIVVTLSQNAVLNDITGGIKVSAIGENKYDPLAGIPATITYIQDSIGNYLVPDKKHALSDFAVNAVNPQYAYDNTLTDGGVSTDYSLYQEGAWAVRDWNAEQGNYGTLSAAKEYIMQTTLYDGTNDNSGGAADFLGTSPTQKVTSFFDAAPDFGSVSTKINENARLTWRIWHPNFTSDIFTSLAPMNNVYQYSLDGSANDSGVVFDIPQDISSAKWKSGDQVSFLFKMGNYTVDHFDDGTNYPLYAVRLKDPNDITSLDLWSFKIKTTRLQRGGVSILNNVIDLNTGEHTVIQVDMKETGNLNVIVMTLDGNIVKYLRHGQTDAGTHYYNWNGTNNGGSKVARGLYFVRVIGPGIDETRKVMCVK